MKDIPVVTKDMVCNNIEQYVIGRKAERNRAILYRRFVDGVCIEPLAEEFGMSVRQIQNIIHKYKNRILGI